VIGIAVLGFSIHLCVAQAFRYGDAIEVVPLDFLCVPLIALIGWSFYGEALDAFVLAGSGLIIAGVIWNLRTEARVDAGSEGIPFDRQNFKIAGTAPAADALRRRSCVLIDRAASPHHHHRGGHQRRHHGQHDGHMPRAPEHVPQQGEARAFRHQSHAAMRAFARRGFMDVRMHRAGVGVSGGGGGSHGSLLTMFPAEASAARARPVDLGQCPAPPAR
jgi:hypothetical protein